MKKFKYWAPTPMDTEGVGSEGQEDWLVLPTTRTRDTGPLEESNFAAALSQLGGESDTVQVHRFGHWGPGWVEIIVVHPSRIADAEEIEKSLDDYPVLDEEDMSRREVEAADEDWKSWGEREFKNIIKKNFELSEEQEDMLDFVDLAGLWREVASELSWSEQNEGNSTTFNFEEAEEYLSKHPDLVYDAIDEAHNSEEYLAGLKKSEDEKLAHWHKSTRGYNPPFGDALYGYDGNGYSVGDRVEIHPSTDQWMMGARYGTVVGVRVSSSEGYRALYGKEKPRHTVKVRLDKMPDKVLTGLEDQFRPIH